MTHQEIQNTKVYRMAEAYSAMLFKEEPICLLTAWAIECGFAQELAGLAPDDELLIRCVFTTTIPAIGRRELTTTDSPLDSSRPPF